VNRRKIFQGLTIVRRSGWTERALAVLVFLGVFVGIASLGVGSRSDLDVYLRRSRAEKLQRPVTEAEWTYPLQTRGGGTLALKDVQASLLFLNFWGTFCAPCIEELPSLLAMARSRAPEGVVVVAVSYDESFDAIDRFFREFTSESIPDNFLVVRDPAGARDLKGLFGTEKIPESYLIRDGQVLARFVNARDWIHPDIVGLFNELLRK